MAMVGRWNCLRAATDHYSRPSSVGSNLQAVGPRGPFDFDAPYYILATWADSLEIGTDSLEIGTDSLEIGTEGLDIGNAPSAPLGLPWCPLGPPWAPLGPPGRPFDPRSLDPSTPRPFDPSSQARWRVWPKATG